MGRYIKNPIEIEAKQWIGFCKETDDDPFFELITPFYDDSGAHCKHCKQRMFIHGNIDTLEGLHIVCPGDWIIRGIEGEFYPVKDSIFKKSYSEVLGSIE